MIEVFDGLIGPNQMQRIHDSIVTAPIWKYGHKSNANKTSRDPYSFWSRTFCGEVNAMPSDEELKQFDEEWPTISTLWWTLKHKTRHTVSNLYFTRAYGNAYTYGTGGSIHVDDGDITMLYYSNSTWDVNWAGGTAFYTNDKKDTIKKVSYVPGRLIVFDSKIPHQGFEPARECDELRTVIVFKCRRE